MSNPENKRQTVGVVTLPGRFNYGNRLQAYASCRAYEKLGFQTICFELERHQWLNPIKKIIKKLLKIHGSEDLMTEEHLNAFDRFNKKINIETVSSIKATRNFGVSLFSTGSDQVFNPNYIKGYEDWYFLSFVRPEQRIALAPSIGLDSLNPKQAECIAEGVELYPSLSIRELRGAELIKQYTGRDATVVCDPTLTVSADEWRAVEDKRLTPGAPYVFTYLLGGGGMNSEARIVLDIVTNHGRIPIIDLSVCEDPECLPAGPAEFIALIDGASHVVADSFHAAVFSSILQTPLTIVHRDGGASMFSRLETLSHMLGIEEKVYGTPEYDLSRAGDYEGVPEAIAAEREKFMAYLEGCLDAQLPGWRESARG